MASAQGLRSLLEADGTVIAAGAYDVLSAGVIERTGLPVVYLSGYGVAASLLGKPDIGLLTITEMVNQVRSIAQAVRIPVIADGDTGYGSPINVTRAVKEYCWAGASAIQLEDQEFPKRCGHMESKRLI